MPLNISGSSSIIQRCDGGSSVELAPKEGHYLVWALSERKLTFKFGYGLFEGLLVQFTVSGKLIKRFKEPFDLYLVDLKPTNS